MFGIRPEDIHGEGIVAETYPSSSMQFYVEVNELLGHEFILHGKVGEQRLVAKVAARLEARPHDTVQIALDLSKAHFFDPQTQNCII